MAAGRRRRLGWRAAVGGVLLAAAAGLGWSPLSDLLRERDAAKAFAAVSRCLWGVEPRSLSSPDSPEGLGDAERRLRAVSVAASMDGRHDSWPGRCEPHVASFRSAVEGLVARHRRACESGGCDETVGLTLGALRSEAGRLAELVEDGGSETLDPKRLFELSTQLGLVGEVDEGAPRAPRPARLLDPDRLAPLYRGDYLRLLTDPAGDAALDLLFYEHEKRYGLCTVPLSGAPTARCRTLSDAIPVGFAGELLAAERGAPRRMYAQGPDGDHWQQALYDVTTGRMISPLARRPIGGFVFKDGTVARLGFEPPMTDVALVRVRDSAEEPPVLVSTPEDASLGPKLVYDEVFWAEALSGGRHRLFAQRALNEDEPLGPTRPLGETVSLGRHPNLEICRTERALSVLLTGRRHRDGALATLLFRGDDGWSEPLHLKLGAGRFGFTCQGGGATLSWIKALEEREIDGVWSDADRETTPVRGRYGVYRLRCTSAGCERGRAVVVLSRHHRASRYVAGDLGEATVVMWRSPLGDIRMRVAPLDDLPGAPEVPLFDDVEHDGFGWDLERDPIFGRAGNMLVLVSRQIGTTDETATYGLVVDGRGRVTPVQTASPEPEQRDLAL